MRDSRAFLQIVHVAGLRVAASPLALPRGHRGLAHDAAAPAAFEALLAAISVADPSFRKLPTWLLATGPLSAAGDAPSLALGRAHERAFAAASSARAWLSLPGDSDLIAPDPARQGPGWFPASWPNVPLIERAPTGRLEVHCVGLDTAGDTAVTPADLARAEALFAQYAPPSGTRALRVLVAHHATLPAAHAPAPHLVLGSSPALAPSLGDLARSSTNPLTLRAGPLMPARASRDPFAQHAQILRLYASPSRPRAVLLERLIVARAHGLGAYRFVPVPARDDVAEELVLEV